MQNFTKHIDKIINHILNFMENLPMVLGHILLVASCLTYGYLLGSTDAYAEGFINKYLAKSISTSEINIVDSAKMRLTALYIRLANYSDTKTIEVPDVDIPDIYIESEKGTEWMVSHVENALKFVPPKILEHLDAYYWTIHTVKKIESPDNKTQRTIGLTKPMQFDIEISAQSDDIRRTVIHEVGHVFDYSKDYFNQYSNAKQWYTLYEEEWRLLYYHKGMLHNVENVQEYFATIFQMCLLEPDVVKELCPKSADYMFDLINKQY